MQGGPSAGGVEQGDGTSLCVRVWFVDGQRRPERAAGHNAIGGPGPPRRYVLRIVPRTGLTQPVKVTTAIGFVSVSTRRYIAPETQRNAVPRSQLHLRLVLGG